MAVGVSLFRYARQRLALLKRKGPATRARPNTRTRALLVAVAFAVTLAVPSAAPVRAAGVTYHVDCSAGDDGRSGQSPSQAWRSMGKANQAPLGPGDRLLFKRGCGWTGPLNARWSGTQSEPITVGAYGTGALPRIENARENILVTGSNLVFEYLFTRSNPLSYDSGCQNQPQGRIMGFRFLSGASYNTVRNSEARDLHFGVWLGSGSHHNRVMNNALINNNVKDSDPNADSGAVAVAIHGDNNEVAYNLITGSDACSRQHGRDGAAVDVYGGRFNNIHHNTAKENLNFMEVGNSRTTDNTFAYNHVTSTIRTANFAVARGANDTRWGPTYRSKLYNNSVYLTGAESFAVTCFYGCNPDVMTFKNNIIWAQDRVGYVDATWDEGNNIYWSPGGPKIWFPRSSSSKTVDPRFVNAAGGDLRLAAGSPAIDAGTSESLNRGYRTDLDGGAVPQGAAVDMGAYERGSGAPPPAPPSTVYAQDDFSRSVADGWGSASTGGAWAPWSPVADFDVNGGEATARVAGPGQLRSAFLPSVRARDVEGLVRVKTDVVASGSGQYAYFVARQNESNEYRAKVHLTPSRRVYVQASRVINNAESSIGSPVSVGDIHAPGGYIWLRTSVTGTGSKTLRIKAWRDGTAEPAAWQYTATDGTAALQGSGSVGLRSYVSSSAAGRAVVFSFDSLRVSAP